MIGRMYAAHPGEGERFYMRMLDEFKTLEV